VVKLSSRDSPGSASLTIQAVLISTFLWQRQAAGSRKQKAATVEGLEVDENQWGRNWVERWMAVRPWENRLLDSNAKENVPVGGDNEAEDNGANDVKKPTGKVPVSSNYSNSSNQKKGAKHKKSSSDASGSSSGNSAAVVPAASLGSSKLKPKAPVETSEEVSSQPPNPAPRSTSNPKERPARVNTPTKKRLSLPNKGKSSVFCCQLNYRVMNALTQKTAIPGCIHHKFCVLQVLICCH
jgi:hypothetical protein